MSNYMKQIKSGIVNFLQNEQQLLYFMSNQIEPPIKGPPCNHANYLKLNIIHISLKPLSHLKAIQLKYQLCKTPRNKQ